MQFSSKRSVLFGAFVALAASPAAAQPDLIIDKVRVDESAISCATGDPVVTVRVFVENQGESNADFGLQRSVVGAAIDDAPYTWRLAVTANDIGAGETEGYTIEIAEGDVKAGRLGEPVGDDGVALFIPTDVAGQNRLPRPLKIRIQEELKEAGFYTGGLDGSLGGGSRAAISRYQESLGDQGTGVLTAAQTDRLLAGGPSRSSYFGGGDRQFYVVVVVDPNSRIPEADETNNTAKFGPYALTGC